MRVNLVSQEASPRPGGQGLGGRGLGGQGLGAGSGGQGLGSGGPDLLREYVYKWAVEWVDW